MVPNSINAADCSVCLAAHDEAIHAATLSVKRWFAQQVTKHFEEDEEAEETVETPAA